jgi:HPt (histidine-containing phosphotransfer) domain-containing protein
MHRRLLGSFLVSAESHVASMVAAASIRDTAAVSRSAHTLKSAARTVGAMRLGELCEALDLAGKAGDATTCSALAESLPLAFAVAVEAVTEYLAS